jgi:Domain of unknown function (DUF4184)
VPFTLAHPAAVLPLRGLRYLRSAPLIVGTLVPDLPDYVPVRVLHRLPLPDTHSFAASFTTDLLLGYLVLFGIFVLRAPLTALLTARGRALCLQALEPFRGRPREWLFAALAIVIGIWTHLAWDSFTHSGGWMVERFAWLSAPVTIGSYTGQVCHALQYLSSVFGLIVVAVWYRRLPTPAVAAARRDAPRSTARPVLLLVVAAALLIGAVQATQHFGHTGRMRQGQGVIYSAVAFFLTHSLTWFALLYLVGGSLATLERWHERVAGEGE